MSFTCLEPQSIVNARAQSLQFCAGILVLKKLLPALLWLTPLQLAQKIAASRRRLVGVAGTGDAPYHSSWSSMRIGRYNDADQVRLSLARGYFISDTNHASSKQLGNRHRSSSLMWSAVSTFASALCHAKGAAERWRPRP